MEGLFCIFLTEFYSQGEKVGEEGSSDTNRRASFCCALPGFVKETLTAYYIIDRSCMSNVF